MIFKQFRFYKVWTFIIIFSPLLLTLTLACERPHPTPSTRENDLQRAYQWIDQNEHEKAIALLTNLQATYPLDQDIKLALASAYVNQSGFDIYHFYHLVNAFTTDQLDEKHRSDVAQAISEGDLRHSLKENLRPYVQPLVALLQFIELFDAIPLLTPENAKLFDHALEILHEDSVSLSRGALLYRILLQVIETKYYVTSGLLQSDALSFNEAKCVLKIGELARLIANLRERLDLIATDLTQLFSDQASNLKNYLEFLDNLIPYLNPSSTDIELTAVDVYGLFRGLGSVRCQ